MAFQAALTAFVVPFPPDHDLVIKGEVLLDQDEGDFPSMVHRIAIEEGLDGPVPFLVFRKGTDVGIDIADGHSLNADERKRMTKWLETRLALDTVRMIIE